MAFHNAARDRLEYLQIGYPIVLFTVFVVAFVVNSILSARKVMQNSNAKRTGPGGRPLPKRSRSSVVVVKDFQRFSPNAKLLFKWLSVGVLLTIVADAAFTITHVIVFRSEHWWRGQSLVVRTIFMRFPPFSAQR